MKIRDLLTFFFSSIVVSMNANCVLDLPMTISGQQALSTSGKVFDISDQKGAMQIPGIDGKAWRTDGHTSYMAGNVGNLIDSQGMTAQVAFAIDTNAIIGHDDENADRNGWAKFVDCTSGNSGFSFALGRRGQFKFSAYVGGQLIEIASNVASTNGQLQLWEWNELTGVVDGRNVRLYLNGTLVGERTGVNSGIKVNGEIMLGRDRGINDLYCGNFRVGDFNGAIDYLKIYDTALTPASFSPRYADLNLPSDRYNDDDLRAKFHGQPGLNWTNETHGLLYNEKDGKYHVIFQRTGSIPGMSHAHYGHIVSDDLFTWNDDKPMIWPSEDYDRRGCWSGCIFKDSKINGGKPAIIYTGVEYGSTSHANIAYCDDDVNLRKWHKTSLGNPLTTYDNVARDTYFFRTDESHAYFIIGDEGHMKSYKYNEAGNSWVYNGHFYDFLPGETGFTEMPNVARLPNEKWLMTFTPWTGSVKCIYRIGEIDANGRFVNASESQLFDFFANDGFCLMSPTIGKDKDGNLVALGIVADKMSTEWNMEKGYAHLYSLPRTLGVDNQGRLTQKPFSGFEKMFGDIEYELGAPIILNGVMNVNPVRGRQAEVTATFTVADASFGLSFLKNSKGKGGMITYNPSDHTLYLDVENIVGEGYGMKRASYQLPVVPARGEDFKIQMFIDHSIVDLFINDRYATSFRVFPASYDYDLIEVFSTGDIQLKDLTAHILGAGDMRGEPIEERDKETLESTGRVAMYIGYNSLAELNGNDEEKKAYDWFISKYGADHVLFSDDLSKISANDYDCIWIDVCRPGINQGYNNLPDSFKGNLITTLNSYLAAGGNLFLTKHAAQIATALGRVEEVNIFNSTAVEMKDDNWDMNIQHYGNDWSTHPIFADMTQEDSNFGCRVIRLTSGSHNRSDYNCIWDINNRKDDFCTRYNCEVLGTWGHDGGQMGAGMVIFYPAIAGKSQLRKTDVRDVEERKGTIIVNGLAAYQWNVTNGVNASHANIEKLTDNVLCYLSPVADNSVVSGLDDWDIVYSEETIYYNLQGLRILNPSHGIYIAVKGGKSRKVYIE